MGRHQEICVWEVQGSPLPIQTLTRMEVRRQSPERKGPARLTACPALTCPGSNATLWSPPLGDSQQPRAELPPQQENLSLVTLHPLKWLDLKYFTLGTILAGDGRESLTPLKDLTCFPPPSS